MRHFDACGIGKLSALYQPQELKVFQICLNLIMESEEGYVNFSDIGNNFNQTAPIQDIYAWENQGIGSSFKFLIFFSQYL